jgi:hypothetical protein
VNSIGHEIVLSTVSTLLVTASVFLPIDLRTQIERIICSSLIVLQQGILYLNYSNDQTLVSHYHTLLSLEGATTSSSSAASAALNGSGSSSVATSAAIRSTNKFRIRRNFNCEPIRYHSSLQNQLLSLAFTELTTLYSNGNRSANLCLVKDVCQLCCGYSETQKLGFEILLTLEALTFPSGGGCGGSNLMPILSATPAAAASVASGGCEISSRIFRELSSPQEEVYLVNKMIPMIQREKERVEDFISNFGRAGGGSLAPPPPPAVVAHGAPAQAQGEGQGEGSSAGEEERTPTPYPAGGQLMMKSIPPLAQQPAEQRIKDDESDDDELLLPEINLADPDLN